MGTEDDVQNILAATSTKAKMYGFQSLALKLQGWQHIPCAVVTREFFSEIVSAISPEGPREVHLYAILILRRIMTTYTSDPTAVWILLKDYFEGLIKVDLLNSLITHLTASSEAVSGEAAKCLLVIAQSSEEMKMRVKLCGIPQTFLTLMIQVPQSLALKGLIELIGFLYDTPLPSLTSLGFQELQRQFHLTGLGMFYKLSLINFSPDYNVKNLLQLKPVIISVLLDSNEPAERLWATTLLKEYIQMSGMTSATSDIVDASIIGLLAKSFSHNDFFLRLNTLRCVCVIGQRGASQCKAILESNIPKCLCRLFTSGSCLAPAACHVIHGLVKGGRLFAIQRLENEGLLVQVLKVLKENKQDEAACLTLLYVIQHGNERLKRKFILERSITQSLCHLVKKKTLHMELYQMLIEMKRFLETAQSLGLMESVREVVKDDVEIRCKIDLSLRSTVRDVASLCSAIKYLLNKGEGATF